MRMLEIKRRRVLDPSDNMKARIGSVVLLFLANMLAAQAPDLKATPVPHVVGPIPVTPASRMFMASLDSQTPLNLPAYGYREEEYFISGTGNVYDWDSDGNVKVRDLEAPYTTRIVVRRPIAPRRFSGTVWVDMLSPARGYDFPEHWGYTNYYLMDHGDVSVGITMFPVTIRALRKFDPKRYATMMMANPEHPLQPCAAAGNNYDYEMEPGLRWDIVSQVGALLKSDFPSRPLADLKVERMFLFAQTGGDLQAYIPAFHSLARLEDGKPIWDGYFMKDGGGPTALNQCGQRVSIGAPQRMIRNVGVPVIRLLVEDMVLGIYDARRPDSDQPNDSYRLYEVPGATHSDGTSVFNWLPSLKTLQEMNSEVVTPFWPFTFSCSPRVGLNDFPVHYLVTGAMRNLDEWVKDGILPPKANPIEVENGGTPSAAILRDQFGNALGGIRSPYVDVPAATYYENFKDCRNMGYDIPFNWEKMKELYGTAENYHAKFNAIVAKMVSEHWIEQKYAARMKAGLVEQPTTEQLTVKDTMSTSQGDLKIISISHASLMFTFAGKNIYIDPVASATDYSKYPKADLILVTHDHPDHLDLKTIKELSTDQTSLVASPICAKSLPDAHILANGQAGQFAGLKIEAVPAYNLVHKRPDGIRFTPRVMEMALSLPSEIGASMLLGILRTFRK
jgi:Alpha/beta hydrolase domain/Beta-lactamase superfamily domain